jgi:aspartyl-tRNA(Asn)/glutamyl-tRNA(Gln) amidotransferase subunit A
VDYSARLDDSVAALTIGVERGYFFRQQVRQEVRDAVQGVIDELEQRGARTVEITIPELEPLNTIGVTIMLADASAIHRRTLREHGDRLDRATRLMLELGELVPATHYITALRARTLVRDAMRRQFVAHELDALLSPTVPATTMRIDRVLAPDESGEDPMSAALKYMIPANITGQPAITVPCGFSPAGLPIGVQLMGRPFAEQTLFRLARAYERNHDWTSVKPTIH